MKKRIITIVALTVTALGYSGTGFAIASNIATANATATIQSAISIEKAATDGDLAFGIIIPDATGGIIVIDPNGDRSTTSLLSLIGTIHHAATFEVTGAPTTSYLITLPQGTITISDGNGNSMPVGEWTCSDANLTLSTNVNGVSSFTVGGSLGVSANQVDGVYTGTFDVTVAYN